MEDALVRTIECGGKRAFIFKPYPPFVIAIGDEFWVFGTLDGIRGSKIPKALKEAIVDNLKGSGREPI